MNDFVYLNMVLAICLAILVVGSVIILKIFNSMFYPMYCFKCNKLLNGDEKDTVSDDLEKLYKKDSIETAKAVKEYDFARAKAVKEEIEGIKKKIEKEKTVTKKTTKEKRTKRA